MAIPLGLGARAAFKHAVIRRIGAPLVLAVALSAGTAGCGGSARTASTAVTTPPSHGPVAERVCDRARTAARARIGEVTIRVVDSDPANLECLLSRRGIRVDVVAQATARAWTEYETTIVHQVQAYGSGAVHTPSQLPRTVRGVGGNAAWIPADHELVATNGTQTAGGTYVTVRITRTPVARRNTLALARVLARATLASAPRGPSPGAPPN